MFARHRNDYVRAGLAHNPALPHELVERLIADDSHTVWVGLAANPGLDATMLLRIKSEKQIEWLWLARNPHLPAEVEVRIRDSGDEQALCWLDRTSKSPRDWPVDRPYDGR